MLTIGYKRPEAGVIEIVDVAVRLPPREVVSHVLRVVKDIITKKVILINSDRRVPG